LHELKLRGFKVNEHIYNQLLRVYAGACTIPNTQDKHVQMYVEDGIKLYRDMIESGIDPNI